MHGREANRHGGRRFVSQVEVLCLELGGHARPLFGHVADGSISLDAVEVERVAKVGCGGLLHSAVTQVLAHEVVLGLEVGGSAGRLEGQDCWHVERI